MSDLEIAYTFAHYPEEAAIIGRLLAGYGEIEFAFALCLGASLKEHHTAFRAVFRMRNESQRIDLIDALLRNPCQQAGLIGPYADCYGAVRHCRKIRNQFAHCRFSEEPPGVLCFTDLERAAEGGAWAVKLERAALPLLKEHEAYYDYTLQYLRFLEYEIRGLPDGALKRNPYPRPARRQQPSLQSPP